MRIRWILPVLMVALASACEDTLSLEPVNEVAAQDAIVNAATARGALKGAYDALQDDEFASYYSGDFMVFSDLASDDVRHSGTFDTYRQVDRNQLEASNSTLLGVWEQLYVAINRTNVLIQKLPDVPGLDADERDDMLGQAYFLRALNYHNLVKLWGGVPLRLVPFGGIQEIDDADITRATTAETYTQILADLAQSLTLLQTTDDPTVATRGAVWALRSRVLLYQGNWAGVLVAADSAEDYGYTLAPEFDDLWTPEGQTPEDIFKISYTAEEAHSMGWYYRAKGYGGRYELAPRCPIVDAFDPDVDCSLTSFMGNWSPTDARAAYSIQVNANNGAPFAAKYPTGIGDEDIHVIRFAEVILNRAEALAQLNRLGEAIAEINRTRARAGLAPLVLGVSVANTQAAVLDAVLAERRLELAFEGHRWPDIVRTGRAVALLGIQNRPHQVLFPIPQEERDVSPNIGQNPGY
jgi:starch-binding outer membrane protein, SusD/RagB family